jgi:endoglucanase
VTWNGTLAPTGVTVPACPAAVVTPPTTGTFGVKASGAKLVSTLDGSPVELIGTDASGLANSQTAVLWPPFANSTLAFWQSVKNYQGTGINVIRLDLNSAFWVGYGCGQSSATYQTTVQHVVSLITQAGMYAIIDLHWDAPNAICPIGQGGFPSTNATAFWKSVADTFKGNPAVIFELFNEPFGDDTTAEWNPGGSSIPILANGGNFTPFLAQNNVNGGNNALITTNIAFSVPGEIALLQTIRGEGATNLVLASTGYWDGAIQSWLDAYNTNGNPDPLKNFGATWHDYAWTGGPADILAVLTAGYPVVITETYGFDANLNAVAGAYAKGSTTLPAGFAYARSQGIGYLCWGTINDWSGQTTLSLTSTPPWAGCTSSN